MASKVKDELEWISPKESGRKTKGTDEKEKGIGVEGINSHNKREIIENQG